jgi:D-alanine-D-alanine ligase
LNKIILARRPIVLVFIAYAEVDGAFVSPEYDDPYVRADVGRWMEALELQWEWVEIAHSNLASQIERARLLMQHGPVVVLNLCDGDDVNGYPGLSVVKALEAANIPFTGARSRFYEISTSKLKMKRGFAARGVTTAPWARIRNVKSDILRAGAELGYPLFIKPDVSAGSAGLTSRSKADSFEEAIAACEALLAGMHGFDFKTAGIYAEPFLAGREFTALVYKDRGAKDGVAALPPIERVFDAAIPAEQRFLTASRVSGEGDGSDDSVILPPDHYAYEYAAAPAALHEEMMELARRAFLAVEGTGYGRVDIRYDAATGRPHVLEVNANCCVSGDETTSVGAILTFAGQPIGAFIGAIIGDALTRYRRRRPEAIAA